MKNNLIWIIFDSCRFDTFQAALTPNIERLGEVERRYSYASWTLPSHAVYMMGATPHHSPKHAFASEVYKKDFQRWSVRLGIPDISFRGFVPQLSLAAFLRGHGYRTNALVSLPVLNQATVLSKHFDHYQLMDHHNDFNAMIESLRFEKGAPSFYLLNVGETHYPYTMAGEKAEDLPIVHGVHGVFKHMDEKSDDAEIAAQFENFFTPERMSALKDKQRSNVEQLDLMFEKLYEAVPPNTYFMVTSDHGELFGEDGFFGHGPIFHEKVFEVFYVEGRLK